MRKFWYRVTFAGMSRNPEQAVDTFSAPKSLLHLAHAEAKKRRMTKSGFYRYCLAKELDHDEATALRVAEHAGIGGFQTMSPPKNPPQKPISYSPLKQRKPRP